MSTDDHFAILQRGVDVWNRWRRENPGVPPALRGTFLTGLFAPAMPFAVKGARARLSGIDLSNADLSSAVLEFADLDGADLSDATLIDTNLKRANLRGARLTGANLKDANLRSADLSGADLSNANLMRATLVETNLEGAVLAGCNIYGVSVWGIKVDDQTDQSSLLIANYNEPVLTVDDLQVAQFVYLLLDNEKFRNVIDSITTRSVLILGRFTPRRKGVLDAIRDELRKRGYIPIVFDFDKPAARDLTETIVTLAHLSRFIVADITEAKSIPQELQAIVPNLPSVAVQPLIEQTDFEYGMFEHFRRYPWVLPLFRYENQEALLEALPTAVIDPAERKVKELRPSK